MDKNIRWSGARAGEYTAEKFLASVRVINVHVYMFCWAKHSCSFYFVGNHQQMKKLELRSLENDSDDISLSTETTAAAGDKV